MFLKRAILAAVVAGLLPAAATYAQEGRAGAKQANQRPSQQNEATQAPRNQPKPAAQAKGDELFMKLQKMTPEEREKALAKLPPARRAQIEKRIQNFQNLPPAVQERRLTRLEKLNSLPLQEQAKVRQSMRDLQALPNDRKRAVNQELQRMSVMGDEERQYHMNTEEFRNRFSPGEQEMVGNLSKVY